MPKNRTKNSPRPVVEEPYIKDFLDMVAPSVIDFKVDHYLCGNTCRCVWALREYPTSTDEQAILRHLGEMDGVTIRIYTRQVTPSEERRIIHNAANKHRMSRSSTEDLQQTVTAEANLQDVVTLVSSMHRNREPLLHCAVFLELTAPDYDALKLLQTDVLTELVRSKLNVDRLMLRQQEGFVSVMPAGRNAFGAQFERVLPASSVANLYPFNYSGKTDPHGFYIGKDKYGANILVDFDKRDDDKTSANILILGNSGQGKSYLLKLLLLNFLEAGKSVISLDVEHEQKDMCETVGGCFMDLMGGVYRINPLEPKCWDDGSGPEDRDAPEAFRKSTRLSQHISFLKDFFRAYKDFSDRHIDAIEIMVGKLYAKWGISDSTNFAGLKPQDYPILSDLYKLIEQEYREYDGNCHQLYTAELLQEILLGLHSMCQGAEAQFFNGHTNVTSSRFIVFGVKGLLQASKNVRGAMLFNILSYMSDRLLTIGNTTAALDELYVWLSDNVSVGTTIIEYIYKADPKNLAAKAKAEKYSKILAKTLINTSGGDSAQYGQNAFFYDSAEGLLTAMFLLVAEYLPTEDADGNPIEKRHIVSVFKLVQELLAPSRVKGKNQFQLLLEKLPPNHKARWFAGSALNTAEQAMASVISTVLSRLNAFLDSEMEQILCFDTAIDAEKFCNEKSAIFIVLPEEDQTKYFMVSLILQNLYREILTVADENGGRLKNRVVFFADELGTCPPIQSLELMFSASRSRGLMLVPIVQSITGQLQKNYGKEGSEIIVDNCQVNLYGGFAPASQTAVELSKSLGSRTVMSGSISRGKNDPSQSLQMMERPLMTPDELKSMPKGSFIVAKTGVHPMKVKLRLFLDWGIRFGMPYEVPEKAQRFVAYADKQELEESIIRRHYGTIVMDSEQPQGGGTSAGGMAQGIQAAPDSRKTVFRP